MNEFEKVFSVEDVREACDAYCSCGGGSPMDGCPACKVWHYLIAQQMIGEDTVISLPTTGDL